MTMWTTTPWVTGDEVLASERLCDIDPDTPNLADIAEAAAQDASDIMMAISGRTITGPIEDTVRPIVPGWSSRSYVVGMSPGCGCGNGVWCPSATIYLDGPVTAIDHVTQDGVVLDPAVDYVLVNGNQLVRSGDPTFGGHRHWRPNQRVDLPATEIGTLEVQYTHGPLPANWMKDGAVEVGAELVRLRMHRDTKIAGASSLSADGTSIVIPKASDAIAKGATVETFPCVLRFISMVNPKGHLRPTFAWSPDIGDLVDVVTFD